MGHALDSPPARLFKLGGPTSAGARIFARLILQFSIGSHLPPTLRSFLVGPSTIQIVNLPTYLPTYLWLWFRTGPIHLQEQKSFMEVSSPRSPRRGV
jgi:hypothetical protein